MSATIKQLQKQITTLEQNLQLQSQRADNAEKAYDYLMHQYKQLARVQFGSRSEKYQDPNHPQQLLFPDESSRDVCDATDNAEDTNVVDIKAHKRCRSTSTKEPSRRVVIIPVLDKQCHCGCQKTVIRYETCEYYHCQPAIFELIEERREVVACPRGCMQSVKTATKPSHVLPKIKASHALLTHIIVSKVVDRQPLYHLEKQFFSRYGFTLTRRTMAQWLIDLYPKLQPLLNLCKDSLIGHDVASLDATTLQVLREPGRPATRKSYAYCFLGGPPDKKVIIYEYNAESHKQYLLDWFAGFKGIIHSDADPFFDELARHTDMELSYCNAHARRKFEPIAKAVKTDGVAHHAMRVYKSLYRIEREAKSKKMTAKQRYQLRLDKSKPLLDEFKIWLDVIYPTLLPKSPLGKAVNYVIKHWCGLIRFLDDGRLEIDNNLTEQQIKQFVVIRKNFLFACSVDGAKALCAHMTLLRTAITNGLEPYRYLKAVLDGLPHCKTVEDFEALLPWHINLDEVSLQQVA